jgi:4'-phosphopantetheinyl transferase
MSRTSSSLRPPPSADIAERFFAPIEIADLANIPIERRHERFFEYWTLKESYIKARGMGLSIPLRQFSFQFRHQGRVQIATWPPLHDDPTRWCFWQFRPGPEYVPAVCAERDGGRVPKLTIGKDRSDCYG